MRKRMEIPGKEINMSKGTGIETSMRYYSRFIIKPFPLLKSQEQADAPNTTCSLWNVLWSKLSQDTLDKLLFGSSKNTSSSLKPAYISDSSLSILPCKFASSISIENSVPERQMQEQQAKAVYLNEVTDPLRSTKNQISEMWRRTKCTFCKECFPNKSKFLL